MTQPMPQRPSQPVRKPAVAGPLDGPLETLEALCYAIPVHPEGTAGQVIRWLEAGCPKADRERLRLGFALEIRAWELWTATVPRLCPDELRAQLRREGFHLIGMDVFPGHLR